MQPQPCPSADCSGDRRGSARPRGPPSAGGSRADTPILAAPFLRRPCATGPESRAASGNLAKRWKRWRKRVGVEPTKDRLTTLTGFEVQPPHQGRVSSDIDPHASAYHDPGAPKRCSLSRLTLRVSP